MGDYTKVNLMRVKDMAPQFGMGDMQARFARSDLELEKVGVTHFKLGPKYRVPFGHKHEDQEEIYVVVEGSARIKVADDILDLEQWDAIHVPGDTMRNLEGGPDGATVIAFGQKAGQEASTMEPGWWPED